MVVAFSVAYDKRHIKFISDLIRGFKGKLDFETQVEEFHQESWVHFKCDPKDIDEMRRLCDKISKQK